jgi:hypothetical protein
MGIAPCIVVAISDDVRNVVAAGLKALGVQATLLASPEELATVLGKIPACGILLEVITSIRASPQTKKAMQELAEFYPFGKFKLAGSEVLILGKESLGEFCPRLPAVQSENAAKRYQKHRVASGLSLCRR